MTDTTFISKVTTITTSWLQDTNNTVYRALGSGGIAPTTPAEIRSNLGLTASSGSSLIGFVQAGTGSVSRTMQDKARELPTAPDRGATGDGLTDNRGAFATADANGAFSVPAGSYRIATSITLVSTVEFAPGAKLVIDGGAVVTFNGPVVAGKWQIFDGAGTVVLGKMIEQAYPEWWGAGPTGTSGAAINKMIAACTANLAPVHFSQVYNVETKLIFPCGLPVTSDTGAIFNASGGAAEGVEISTGNGGRQVFPKIAGFTTSGLKLKGVSLGDINTHAIDNCGSALVLETVNATHPNLLDTKITIHSIGGCANAVRVSADNNANVMQGNEVYINFATSCTKAVFFDANMLTPSWDSNAFVFEAIDPTASIANSRGLDSNAYDAPRTTFICRSWFGGFAASGVYINGSFNGLTAEIGLAEVPASYSKMALVGQGNRVITRRRAGASTTPVTAANAAASRATFNGGAPLYGDKERIRITLSGNVLAGGVYNAWIYHLKTDRYSEAFRVVPINMAGMIPAILSDQSGTNANEIWIQLLNASGATIAGGTNIDFYFEIGQ